MSAVSKNPSATRWLLAVGAIVLAFFVLHQSYVSRVHPDAVYLDTLRILHQWEEWRAGRLSFYEYWSQNGGSHRGFINQAFLIANIEFFSLDELLANRLTGCVLAVFAFVTMWSFVANPEFRERAYSRAERLAIALGGVVVAGLVFSWASFEVFTQDLGLSLWFKNLCFLVYFCCHARMLADRGAGWSSGSLLAFGGAAVVLLVGMGWNYAFVCSVVAVHCLALGAGAWSKRPVATTSAWLATGGLVVSLLLYMSTGGSSAGGAAQDLLRQAPELIVLTLAALGGAWIGGDLATGTSWLPTLWPYLGLVSIVACVLGIAWRLKRGVFTHSLLPLYLIAYGGLVAVSVSVARGLAGGEMAVVASRYYMDVVFLQLGALWLLLEHAVDGGKERRRLPAIVFFMFAVATAYGLVETYTRQWQIAPYRRVAIAQMNDYLRLGVPDKPAADLLQSPLADAQRGSEVMRRNRLSIFADVDEASLKHECGPGGVQALGGWYGAEPAGRWSSAHGELGIAGCECPFSLRLFVPATFSKRAVTVMDGQRNRRTIDIAPGHAVDIVVPASGASRILGMSVAPVTVPERDLPGSQDLRELGVLWVGTSYVCPRSGK